MMITLAFTNPWALVLLVLLPYTWYVSKRSLAGLSPFRRRLALALRTLLLLALVLGIAGAQAVRRITSMQSFFVVDLSRSMPRGSEQTIRQYINAAAKSMRPDDQAGIICFGAEGTVEEGLRSLEFRSDINRSFTNISSGVRLAEAAMGTAGERKIVLFTDGNENLGSATREAAELAAEGIGLDIIPTDLNPGKEVLVEKLVVPAEAKRGEPVEAEVVVSSTTATTGKLYVYSRGDLLEERPVTLEPGKQRFGVSHAFAEPGVYELQARLEVGSDTVSENNVGEGCTAVRGEPTILVISSDLDGSRYLIRALQQSKIRVVARGLSGLPQSLDELRAYDAVVLDDVPGMVMSEEQMRMLRSGVHDLGIGLTMIGGENSFGAGGYLGTPVEEALPVFMDVKKRKEMPAAAVVMIMHSCEFQDGDLWGKRCCTAVVDTLGPQDKAGVVRYGTADGWQVPLQSVKNKARINKAIRNMITGDMPSFDPTLKLAYQALRRDNSAVKHVIVLSDGDPDLPNWNLIKSAARAGISTTAVCIMPHSPRDWQTMRALAQAGKGRAYRVAQPKDVPKIFMREAQAVARSPIVEEPFRPVPRESGPLLKGMDASAMPPLLGYVATAPKALANTQLVTHRGDPLLASWSYGIGKAVAFTSDDTSRWAAAWLGWGGYPTLWTQAIRWTMRHASPAEYDATVEIDRGVGRAQVQALTEGGEFVNNLTPQATIISPSIGTSSVRLDQVAPGTYETTFEAKEMGTYVVHLSYRTPEGKETSQTASASIPYSPEYRQLETNLPLLTRLKDVAGGRFLKTTETQRVFGEKRVGSRQSTDIWQLLLVAAVLLFPLDVAVRRLALEREHVAAAMAYLAAALAPLVGLRPRLRRRVAEEEPPGEMGMLFRAKRRAGVSRGEVPPPPPPLQPPEPGAAPPPPPPRRPTEAAPPAPTEDTPSVLSRLKDAKKRARGEEEGK